jgi:hypothetical protein
VTELGMGDAFDLDLAASTILSGTRDVQALLKALAGQLQGALGDQVTVARKGGLLRKSDDVRALDATIGTEQFHAELHGTGVSCTIGHSSGGIRIRSEQCRMDEWLHRLLEALRAEADHSQTARQALENMVIGGP